MGKVIAFANQKGGVGKSTLTVQAAFYLRKHRKKKVLVIDIDSQGNTTESLTQGQPYTATSSAALFEPNLEELGIFDDTPYGVDLIGSEQNSNEGYDIESRELDVIRNPAANIQAIKDAYDYILVDCPPSLGRKLLGGLVMRRVRHGQHHSCRTAEFQSKPQIFRRSGKRIRRFRFCQEHTAVPCF